jgi:hypothetical protein
MAVPLSDRLNKVHRDLCRVSGRIILRVTKRTLNHKEMLEWIEVLRHAASELETIANERL